LALWAIGSGLVNVEVPVDSRLRTRAFGRDLRNPLGIAAGFDKNGDAIDGIENLGFGFVEIGTVTPLPQPGNPKPRLFRDPANRALINRLGFNNKGADEIAIQVRARQSRIPLGINIGKNAVTSLERAVDDYAAAYEKLAAYADYVVVNVSSPNTPGLRTLQKTERLAAITSRIRKMEGRRVFVKVSPDEPDESLRDIAHFCRDESVGIVATNTRATNEGGLSGAPLCSRSEAVCALMREEAGGDVEIVGVGGIFDGQDLFRRLRAGATVCQIYTALVYRGPSAAALILQEYLDILDRQGA
jgi:dihydroorotate dehydrogenase